MLAITAKTAMRACEEVVFAGKSLISAALTSTHRLAHCGETG